MKRREFMALVGASAVAWPTSAPAQQPGKPYRIAPIHPFAPVETLNEATSTLGYRFFFEEFRRLGCVEGSNVVIDRYSGLGKKSGQPSESDRLGRKAHIYAILAMTASLAASSGQAQEGHVANNVPDYVATREHSGPPTRQENLRHHGGWLRVDIHGGRSSYFEGPGRHVGFTRALDGDRYDSFGIRQEVVPSWTRPESVKTGKLETYLGETCTIWDLVSPADPIGRIYLRDCITHDGIRMAHGWAAEDGGIREPPEWRLTSLTRTAVPEEETSPPAELFDWRNFTAFAAPTPSLEAETEQDFVATMDGHYASGAGVRYRKRHFPWLRTDTKFANGAWIIEIVNERTHAELRFRAAAQGAFESLSISGPQILSQDSWSVAGSVAEQKDVIVKFGTLLGQECKITTDMRSERIRTEWRTADGIVLKEEEAGGRAYNPEDWTVVELQRRPVELSEVMPPADIFERARWGLSR